MKQLYFIRHGLSEMNVTGKLAGQVETPLTNEGRRQAKAAGQAAKALNIDYIICSPLSRAYDTAKIIALAVGFREEKIDVSSLVIERNFGPWEGKKWLPDLNLDGFADIETSHSLIERAHLTLRHLQAVPADVVLVVSHGAFGRALRHAITPAVPYHGSPRFANAEIVRLL